MSKLTRQELYDKIKESSKDEYILSEMIRLGFWKDDKKGQPSLSNAVIKKHGELSRELNDLLAKQRRYKNKELLLQDIHKKRMVESKQKQEETKKRREAERMAKAHAWKKKQEQEIVFLGEGYSKGLNKTESNSAQLNKFKLDDYPQALNLAQAMNISLNELRFLAFSRKTSTISHYKRFYLPKKSGGKRLISAPMPRLKKAQNWVLHNILYKVPVHDAANGFAQGRSIKSNAIQHVGSDVLVNMDLKDFFPTLDYKRVKGLYRSLGYSSQISTILALICTEADVDAMHLDGKKYFVTKNERHLPQGAPCSPAITNLICHRLDRRLMGAAKKWGFNYSRYADDLSFSASGESKKDLNALMWQVKEIIANEGFNVHPDKTRIMRKGSQQEVTGIIVNDKVGINRKTLRKFRAVLFQIEKDGIAGKKWGKGHILNTIQGYANFVNQIDPEKGAVLIKRVKNILKYNAYTPAQKTFKAAPVQQVPSPAPAPKVDKNDNWWEVW